MMKFENRYVWEEWLEKEPLKHGMMKSDRCLADLPILFILSGR